MKKLATASNVSGPASTWRHPNDWLPLGSITETDEKVLMLAHIDDVDSNYVAFSVSGNYTVDWGDGTVTDYSSGVVAGHNYSYADAALAGTETNDGRKQAIITITPQSGQQITAFNVYAAHPDVPGAARQGVIREITASLPNVTSLASSLRQQFGLQCVRILSWGAITSLSAAFYNNYNLKYVQFPATANASLTNLGSLFYSCYALQYVSYFDTSAVTSWTYAFFSCRALREIPPLDFSAATSLSYAFNYAGVRALPTNTDLSAVTTADNVFDGSDIEEVGDLNLSSLTGASRLFRNCLNLRRAGSLNMPAVTTMIEMFRGSSALQSVGQITTTSALLTMGSAFYQCYALEDLPVFETGSVTDISYALGYTLIPVIGAFDFSSVTVATEAFAGNLALRGILATGLGATTSILNSSVGVTELDAIYTNLATVGSETITVTNNPGTAGDDPTIATAKGWTVVG